MSSTVIKSTARTYLKSEIKDSSQLAASQKMIIAKDTVLELTDITGLDRGHYGITLKEPIKDFDFRSCYVFAPHWGVVSSDDPDIVKESPAKDKESVPNGITYTYPTSYRDGRTSICQIPSGFVQEALSEEDFQSLSREFDLNIAVIKAVMAVEAAGSGFLINEPTPARPKILFEAHWFYKLTPQPVSRSRPDLSSRVWDKSLYKGGSAEWGRLLDAMEFDEIQALKSASYGIGQVMGFNYTVAGCTSIQQFIEENFAGEYWQARHMMNFIVNNNLIDELKRLDWAGFARGYNGSGFRRNKYDTKLANAYSRFLVA